LNYDHNSTRRIKNLSRPKRKNYYGKELSRVNPYFHTEFKGLISTSIGKEELNGKYPYARHIHKISEKAREWI